MSETPDVTPLVDLRIHDRDSQDIFDSALIDLQTKMPTWNPREDNTEVLLMETLATEVAESIFAINRLPGAIMVALMKLYGVERHEGSAPTGTITVTAVDSFEYTIPLGTRFSLPVDDETSVLLQTTAVGIIADGAFSTTIPVVATEKTASLNGIAVGTPVAAFDSITFVESATLASPLAGGTDPESDASWLSRSLLRLQRLSDTLVLPEHFRIATLEYPEVAYAYVLDNANGTSTGLPGHVTIAVYGHDGPLTEAQMLAIKEALELKSHTALQVHVQNLAPKPIAASVTIDLKPGATLAEVQAATPAALANDYGIGLWDSTTTTTIYGADLARALADIPGIKAVRSTPATSWTVGLYEFPQFTIDYVIGA